MTDQGLGLDLFGEPPSILEAVARGGPLEAILDEVALVVERRVGGHCSIAAVADDGRVVHHGSHLPRGLVARLNRSQFVEVPSAAGSEGAGGQVVVVVDPADGDLDAGASWTLPLIGSEPDVVLGALVVLQPERRPPTAEERRVLERSGLLAVVVLERNALERRLHHRALHDDLTGLPNRHFLLNRIRTALDRRRPGTVAVLFVDLDRFKATLGRLGDDVGDRVLQQVATRLRKAVRPGDTVARFGGDQFVVLCEGIAGEEESEAIATRLTTSLAEPIAVDEAEVFLSASVGIARTVGGDTAETLIRNAELAMARAKEQGGGRWSPFHEDLREALAQQLELEGALRGAIADGELHLVFQPQVRLVDGRLTGVEALVRWARPGVGLVPPDLFVPMAERTGLILALGEWVLEQAVAVLAELPPTASGHHLGMTVNLAARQLAEPGLLKAVADVLERHGVEPGRLCLEVTETALVRDPEASAEVLDRLKALGVRLAIDDFGTGYATLDYARRFSMADVLKIDATFVAGLGDPSSKDRAIVSAAIVLARALGYATVAEGVESDGQLAVLAELGCDEAQGFLFSPAVPPAELVDLLSTASLLPA